MHVYTHVYTCMCVCMTTEIEAKKQTSTSFSANSSDTIPRDKISHPMHDISSVACNITQLLQHCDGALERMLITFKQVTIVMKSVTHTALVNSKEYDNINSVRAFFRLLTPYWNPVDCSLLAALVKASECKAAIRRLQAYLSSTNKVGEDVVLGEEIKDSDILLPAVTGKDVSVTVPEFQESPPNGSPPSNKSATTASPASAPDHSPPHSAGSGSPHHSDPPDQPPEADITLSQPTALKDSLLITAKVAQDRVTLAEYDRKASLLCGLLRLPRFMLQYEGVEPGSVVIKWITSEGLLPYILSNMVDDGDLQLLLQENIVKVQVGSEYIITVGSRAYWRVSEVHVSGCSAP